MKANPKANPMANSMLQRVAGVVGLTAVVALAGCGHAHSVEDPTAAERSQANPGQASNATPPSDRKHTRPASTPAASPDKQAAPSEVPLSTSPAGQLKDGAVKKIQDRLVAQDFLNADQKSGELDARTSEGLRKFQKARDLAATGTPDQETVRKLGLDPKEIFRAAR